jgi:hypothetical protein
MNQLRCVSTIAVREGPRVHWSMDGSTRLATDSAASSKAVRRCSGWDRRATLAFMKKMIGSGRRPRSRPESALREGLRPHRGWRADYGRQSLADPRGSGSAVFERTCFSAKLERIFSMPGMGVSCSRMKRSSAAMSASTTRIR